MIKRAVISWIGSLLIAYSLQAQNYQTLIVVAQDGSGDHTTIQSAIDATKSFPDVPIQIYIKNGVYKEKVIVYSWNTKLSLIGDSTGTTTISYGDYFKKIDRGRNSTFHTYTLKVEANEFTARDLVIENTAGEVGQAVALHVESDRVVFESCTFKGNQDTMYLAGENARQYFKNCTIYGTTDYIFGQATAVFESCEIISLKSSYITAASTIEDSDYGFVFKDCKIKGEELPEGKTYLGRPWRKYAKTVFINCELGAHIIPVGWKEWNSKGTAFYAEYNSIGAGANPANRVDWSHQLTKKELKKYTLEKIFRGWNPLKSYF